jgi:hypothetical protein
MPEVLAIFGLAVLIALTLAWAAEAHHLNTPKRSARGDAVKHIRPGCFEHSTMRHYYRWAKHKYTVRKRPLTEGQALHVKHLALCLATREKSDWAYAKRRLWKARFRERLYYYRLTPYDCGSAGRFAIPCYIVACESGYSWSAYNPSGAAGPYQIMESWGRPWPANTWARRMAHHRLAASIWRGGAGASNWVCA